MPATLLSAQVTDPELTLRQQARVGARRTLPDPAATTRALALAICEVEAGLRSASQLERICHPSLWDAVAKRIQRAGGLPVSAASVLRVQVQELTPGWWMRWRWSAGASERCSSRCGWRQCQAAGSSSSSSTTLMLGSRRGASRVQDSPRRLSTTSRSALAPVGAGR
jgi:Family of unknown function (DUF6459)